MIPKISDETFLMQWLLDFCCSLVCSLLYGTPNQNSKGLHISTTITVIHIIHLVKNVYGMLHTASKVMKYS